MPGSRFAGGPVTPRRLAVARSVRSDSTSDRDSFRLAVPDGHAQRHTAAALAAAGIVLDGWEVKAIRAGRANLAEAYVIVKDGALYLIGSHITPLQTASTHVHPDPTRTRKLLLRAEEVSRLIGRVERAGYTLVPLDMHYRNGWIKLEIGLAKGKRQHDKRQAEKDREWQREQQRVLRRKA